MTLLGLVVLAVSYLALQVLAVVPAMVPLLMEMG